MKTAAEGIDLSRLSATIKVDTSSSPFCFVSKLALVAETKIETTKESEKNLLLISNKAAFEIRDILTKKENLAKEVPNINRFLKKFDVEDFSRLSEKESDRPGYSNYFFSREFGPISSRFVGEIQSLLRNAKNFDDFRKNVESLASPITEELETLQGQKLNNKVTTFAGEESSIPNYILYILSNMSKIKVLSLTERRDPIGEEEAARLLELKVSRGGSVILRDIQETVSSLLGVNIDAFQGNVSSRQSEKRAELDVDDFLVQVNGSGIREALRIVLDVEFLRPDILLVEEPEVYLHPSLETSMMQYLKRKSANCQIFITTHSTNFLDTAEMKNIYLVSKLDSTMVEHLNLEEAEEKIPRELGIRLSSLFMYDRLIFVEGPSDESILRELASKLELNLGQYNIGFIKIGGVRNFAYYATGETLSFLTKRRVEIWFLIDKDEKYQEYFKKLETVLKGKATFKVLNKRELENYLIRPRPLREFIKLKYELSGTSGELPDESRIKEEIDKCADQLKQFTINKRLFLYLFSHIHPPFDTDFEHSDESKIKENALSEIQKMVNSLEEQKGKVDEIYSKQREFVNGNWNTIKLSVVPGDILLDNVCRKYGFRFNKVKDGERLARLMVKGEIDGEIKNILKDICNNK